MSDAWDAMKNFDNCSETDSMACAESLHDITGVSVWAGQTSVDVTQAIRILINPVVSLFFWIVVLLVGILLHKLVPSPATGLSSRKK